MLETIKIETDKQTSKLLEKITDGIEEAIENGLSESELNKQLTTIKDSLDKCNKSVTEIQKNIINIDKRQRMIEDRINLSWFKRFRSIKKTKLQKKG